VLWELGALPNLQMLAPEGGRAAPSMGRDPDSAGLPLRRTGDGSIDEASAQKPGTETAVETPRKASHYAARKPGRRR
jgi:hypothetical protein